MKGLDQMTAALAALTGQMPYATSRALNSLGNEARIALRDQTKRSFNQPRNYTINAMRYTRSTKANLSITVGPDPSRQYFDPETFGGSRYPKRYEGYLRGLSQGRLSGRLVPTSLAVQRDGNPRRSVFALIAQNMQTNNRGGFILGTPRGGDRKPGVYRRSRGRLIPYFLQVQSPQYQPRFPLQAVGERVARDRFPTLLSQELDKVMMMGR